MADNIEHLLTTMIDRVKILLESVTHLSHSLTFKKATVPLRGRLHMLMTSVMIG